MLGWERRHRLVFTVVVPGRVYFDLGLDAQLPRLRIVESESKRTKDRLQALVQ